MPWNLHKNGHFDENIAFSLSHSIDNCNWPFVAVCFCKSLLVVISVSPESIRTPIYGMLESVRWCWPGHEGTRFIVLCTMFQVMPPLHAHLSLRVMCVSTTKRRMVCLEIVRFMLGCTLLCHVARPGGLAFYCDWYKMVWFHLKTIDLWWNHTMLNELH